MGKEETPQAGPCSSALSEEDKQEEKQDSSFPGMSSIRSTFSLFPDSWGILQGVLKFSSQHLQFLRDLLGHSVFQP